MRWLWQAIGSVTAFGVKGQRLAGEGAMPPETGVPAGSKGGEEVAPLWNCLDWICKRLGSSWFALRWMRGEMRCECRLTAYEFSGNTRANARVLSAATRG